ncbi:MAG: restriction endonuclease subunit S [Phycisphaerales bacterium]
MSAFAPAQIPSEAGERGFADIDTTSTTYPFSADPVVPLEPTRPGWRWHRLTAIARLATGHTPSRRCPEYWNGDIPWLQLPDIRALDGGVALDTLEHTNELGIKNSAAVLLPEGTVCLSRTASVGFVTVMGRPMATSQDFVNWVCGPELSPEFLKWLLVACRQPIRQLGSGATHQTIYFPTVEQFSVCIPPRVEQERIAARLTARLGIVERAQAAATDRLALAESLPASLLREVFDGPDASGWETRTIDEFATTCSGATPSRGNAEFFGGGIPWVKTGELRDGFVGDDGSTEESVTEAALGACSLPLLPPKTLLIAMYGQGKTRGRTGILTREATTNQACFAILPDPSVFETSFLQLWFRAKYSDLRALTENRGGNQPNLNGVLLRELQVPLPDVATQRRIAADLSVRLAAAENVIARCRQELADLEALPSALLRAAFNGAS